MSLVTEHGSWRIWNVVDRSDPAIVIDLRAELAKDIRSLAAASRHKPSK
jgi:hypothetical protein